MTRLSAWKMAGAVFILCAAAAIGAQAQTFTTLESFHGREGGQPWFMSLVQGRDGNLYGTTMGGEPHCLHFSGCGTVFKMTPGGQLTTIYSFCSQPDCTDGAYPEAGLVLGTDGNFYGTTWGGGNGGPGGYGTVFKITPHGQLTTLYRFCTQPRCPDGNNPVAELIQATDGNLYGTTNGSLQFWGTVFRITPSGLLTTLHTFGGGDGANPYAGLVQASDGNFYGAAVSTIFKMTPKGNLAVLHRFNDNSQVIGRLIQAADGDLYGTAANGGAKGFGSAFKITLGGVLTTLYSFCSQPGCSDGYDLTAGLVQATDGNFYGVTSIGGNPNCVVNGQSGCGTIFQLTPGGTLTTLHSFHQTDGIVPYGALLQATDGTLYGTTFQGGDITCTLKTGCGTVFSLDMGIGPFVAFVQAAGKVGQTGGILGQALAGTTSIAINGIQANFTVVSDTFLRATIPAGATTGFVTVTTPSGTLTSDKVFRVLP